MAEVQGYAHRARLELAGVLRALGDLHGADALEAEAAELREPHPCALLVPGHRRRSGLLRARPGR